jgi:competence protein ComEC
MTKNMNKRIWTYLLSTLSLIAIVSWLAVLTRPSSKLRIIACDVGQGDAILISTNQTQVLVDGGPNNRVISCLSRHMPFWDRNIEVVVLTHADADHSTGLVEVLRDYSVNYFVYNGQGKDTNVYKALIDVVRASEVKEVVVQKNDRLVYGELYFDILHPAQIPPEGDKANDYSIVMKLTYGEFDALLTGDIEDAVSDYITESFNLSGTEYLKVPHHGSKNGLSQKLFEEARPQLSVISAGASNRFGHPHEEVLAILRNSDTRVLGTYEVGDVEVESDGRSWNLLQ